MAQRHLFGTNYVEMTPPLGWPELQVESTVNDSSTEANINVNSFSFVGKTAKFLLEDWIPTYGVFNGCPYRIEIYEGSTVEVVFDGFIVLSEMELNSSGNPSILVCPVRELNNNITVLDKISVLTQGVLKAQGFLVNSDYEDMPVTYVPKITSKDRFFAISNLTFQVLSFFIRTVQNFLSAISDIFGFSVLIGLIELSTLFINLAIEINQLMELIEKAMDLLLASQRWYKAISLKTILTKSFLKEGYTVDFGQIDAVISKTYIKSSENGFIGAPIYGMQFPGTMKKADYGYLISECMELTQNMFNTRVDVRDGVVHIKSKNDPFWTASPSFTPTTVLIEKTTQYENGFYRNKTEEVYSTFRFGYLYDALDAWTLTENIDDSHEVHRDLITELDPKMNTLKGLKDIQIPMALGVRYDVEDTLMDLAAELGTISGDGLGSFQLLLDQFSNYIDTSGGGSGELADILSLSNINLIFSLNSGSLKIEDDTFGIPKIFYADLNTQGVLDIPVNFKDYLGGAAIYNNYYAFDSPAEEHNFIGQYREVKDLTIPFSLTNFQLTKENPYFILEGSTAKFEHNSWNVDGHKSESDIEINEPFDTNIKENTIL